MLFPCGQFLNQEPGKGPDREFVRRKSSVDLDQSENADAMVIMEKIEVNGANAHPAYEFLRYNSELFKEAGGSSAPIPWNFAKFLIDKDGAVFKYYSPNVNPDQIKPDIESLLKGTNPPSPAGRRPTMDLSSS